MATTHPLMRPAAWALWTGASGMPAVRRAGALFWLTGSVALATWLLGLVHEALVWGVPAPLWLSGLAVAVGWAWLAWSTWSAWCADQKRLTLLWTGPVAQGQGGFRVVQWQAPVHVEVLLDLQRWMLLRVSAAGPSSSPSSNPAPSSLRQAWLWLQQPHDAELAPAGRHEQRPSATSLHQLRSLLQLPTHLTMALPSPADAAPTLAGQVKAPLDGGTARLPASAMASWLHSIKSGFKLRALPYSPRMSASDVAHDMANERLQPRHAARESSFPSTVVMRDEDLSDDCMPQRVGGHG